MAVSRLFLLYPYFLALYWFCGLYGLLRGYFNRYNGLSSQWINIYNLKPEAIDLLAGTCQTVCYSIETASRRLQKILRKVIPMEKILEVNKYLRKSGINTVHNFLFGIPTETIEETKKRMGMDSAK